MKANQEEDFRDRIATVNSDGERIWIYPKRVDGPYYKWRKIISYIQLIVLIGVPFIKYNGKPIIMLNVLERKFIFFGNVFWPEDLYIFGLLFITTVIFVVWFTATLAVFFVDGYVHRLFFWKWFFVGLNVF